MSDDDGSYEQGCADTFAEYKGDTAHEIAARIDSKQREVDKLYAEMNELKSLGEFVERLGN